MNHFPSTSWGKPRYNDDMLPSNAMFYSQPSDASKYNTNGATQHTTTPIVTGTSVIAIKYRDGVIMAADTLGSYGSMARFRDLRRLHSVGNSTLIGCSGDMADFQVVQGYLADIVRSEAISGTGYSLSCNEIYTYLSNVMYAKRSKMDPFWNSFLVGGVEEDGEVFLGYVDLLGTTYSSATLATGYGNYLAIPLLRSEVEKYGTDKDAYKKLSEEEAREIILKCMKVLFYRDARSINKFQVGKITKDGITIDEPISVPTEWSFAENLRGYGNSDETI